MYLKINPIATSAHMSAKNIKKNEKPTDDIAFKATSVLRKPSFVDKDIQKLSDKILSLYQKLPEFSAVRKPFEIPFKKGVVALMIDKSEAIRTKISLKIKENAKKINDWNSLAEFDKGIDMVINKKGQMIEGVYYEAGGCHMIFRRQNKNLRRILYKHNLYIPSSLGKYYWERIASGEKIFSTQEKINVDENKIEALRKDAKIEFYNENINSYNKMLFSRQNYQFKNNYLISRIFDDSDEISFDSLEEDKEDDKYNVVLNNRATINKNGAMQLIMPDEYYPGVENVDGKPSINEGLRAKALTSVRNHANKLGGKFSGIIARLPEISKEGVKRIVGTPFKKDSISSQKYWTENAYRVAPNLGTEEEFKTLQNILLVPLIFEDLSFHLHLINLILLTYLLRCYGKIQVHHLIHNILHI